MDDVGQHLVWAVCFCAWLETPDKDITIFLNKCERNTGDGSVLYPRYAALLKWHSFPPADSMGPLAYLVSLMVKSLDPLDQLLVDTPSHTMEPFELVNCCRLVACALAGSVDDVKCKELVARLPAASSAPPVQVALPAVPPVQVALPAVPPVQVALPAMPPAPVPPEDLPLSDATDVMWSESAESDGSGGDVGPSTSSSTWNPVSLNANARKRRKTVPSEDRMFPLEIKCRGKKLVRGPEFRSLDECRAFLLNSSLHCCAANRLHDDRPELVATLEYVCSHMCQYVPGVHERGKGKKKIKSQVLEYNCPWRAKIRSEKATGRTFLYLPPRDDKLFWDVISRPEASYEPGVHGKEARVILHYENQAVFVSEFGHVHTLDGSGATKAPTFVHEAVEAALFTDRSELNARTRLMSRPSIAGHSKHLDASINAILKKTKNVAAETPTTFAEQWEVISKELHHKCSLDKLPEAKGDVMFVTRYVPDVGHYRLIGTREAFEYLINSTIWYSDATHGVIERIPSVKVLGIMGMDAAHSAFPFCFMQCEGETVKNYKIMFELVEEARAMLMADGASSRMPKMMVFDGFRGLKDLIREIYGEDCVRLSCWFHMLYHFDKRISHELKVTVGLREAAKRAVAELSRASSAFALMALFKENQRILKEMFPNEVEKVDQVIKILQETYLNRENENFGWFGAFCTRIDEDFIGQIASRASNAAESIWSSLAACFRRVMKDAGTLPRTPLELDIIIAKYLFTFKYKHYTKEYDVSRRICRTAKEWKLKGMQGARIISAAHLAVAIDLPGDDERFFLLAFRSGLIQGLDKEDVESAIGELVDNRGDHLKLSGDQFNGRVDALNLDRLIGFHAAGYLIQFHEAHPPGSPRSFRYADCNCFDFRRVGLCVPVLAIHFLYLQRRENSVDQQVKLVARRERDLWPTDAAYSQRFAKTNAAHAVADSFPIPNASPVVLASGIGDDGEPVAITGTETPTVNAYANADLFGATQQSGAHSPSDGEPKTIEQTVKEELKKDNLNLFMLVGNVTRRNKSRKDKDAKPGSVKHTNQCIAREVNEKYAQIVYGQNS